MNFLLGDGCLGDTSDAQGLFLALHSEISGTHVNNIQGKTPSVELSQFPTN